MKKVSRKTRSVKPISFFFYSSTVVFNMTRFTTFTTFTTIPTIPTIPTFPTFTTSYFCYFLLSYCYCFLPLLLIFVLMLLLSVVAAVSRFRDRNYLIDFNIVKYLEFARRPLYLDFFYYRILGKTKMHSWVIL